MVININQCLLANYFTSYCIQIFSDETGKAVTYEDETIFSHIEEWRMNLEHELGVENFLHGR